VQNLWLYITKGLRNKYVITLLVFAVYLIFFQQYNWIEQLNYKQEREALKQKKQFYQTEIEKIVRKICPRAIFDEKRKRNNHNYGALIREILAIFIFFYKV